VITSNRLNWTKESIFTLSKESEIRPILAYFAGLCARPGYTMGHSGFPSCKYCLSEGAIKDSRDSNDGAIDKIRAFRKAGIKVLDHIGYIGEEMRELLTEFRARQ